MEGYIQGHLARADIIDTEAGTVLIAVSGPNIGNTIGIYHNILFSFLFFYINYANTGYFKFLLFLYCFYFLRFLFI